ncbi:MAG: malate/lactate/ureidoglycolate dehydrogenase [Ramlibacter sp.]
MARTFQAAALRKQVAAIISAAGSSAEEARTVADNLVLANLSGHDSHGVGMVPRYVDAVLEGGLKPNASAKVLLDGGSLLSLDGRRGYGQVVGEQAMVLGMARAKELGSCILALANAHHLGRIGHFAEMAVTHGLVAIHFVNVQSRPVVAPWGGADGRYGTNPCCIGVPLKGREPFVLDFATSRVAQGKMRVAHNEGRQVEPGYLIDEKGLPTTDPGVVVVPQSPPEGAAPGAGLFGALLPFGEHKGYGMAVACELLGGALTGSGTWHRPADTARSVINGMLTILIDPQKLGTRASFEKEALAFVDWLRQSPPAPGSDGVKIAGEPERAARAKREREGIEIDDTTWNEVVAAAAKFGSTMTV